MRDDDSLLWVCDMKVGKLAAFFFVAYFLAYRYAKNEVNGDGRFPDRSRSTKSRIVPPTGKRRRLPQRLADHHFRQMRQAHLSLRQTQRCRARTKLPDNPQSQR